MTNPASFFATLQPDAIGAFLGSDYLRFTTDLGIEGLAKVKGERLDLLAIMATEPGTGQFRRFIEAAKAAFTEIYVWEIWNSELAKALHRYAFTKTTGDELGETTQGFGWHRPSGPVPFFDCMAQWIADHPACPNPLVNKFGPDPAGRKCKACVHITGHRLAKTYYKCKLRGSTHGPATDHRLNWPACAKFEAR